MQKSLVVNADDFGMDPAINSGIMGAFREGIVTSASLLACAEAFEEAAGLARKETGLGIGIHLALNEERPVLAPDKIKSLFDAKRGCFLGLACFLKEFLYRKIALKEAYLEFEAQIKKFIKAGLKPTHIDSHKHIHLLPGIFEVVIELSKRHGISHIRIPGENFGSILKSGRKISKIGLLGLSMLSNVQSKALKRHNMSCCDYCHGLSESGRLDKFKLAAILKDVRSGANELICHPGFTTPELASRHKGFDWLSELKALTAPEIKVLVGNLNIRLARHNEI